jgi:hypothetical protein
LGDNSAALAALRLDFGEAADFLLGLAFAGASEAGTETEAANSARWASSQ